MPRGDAYSSGHLVPSLWDLHMFYLLRPILFRPCRYFTGLCSSNIPRYFLDFPLRRQRLWLYYCAHLVAFYDTLGIRRTYSQLKPPASSRGICNQKIFYCCKNVKITSQFHLSPYLAVRNRWNVHRPCSIASVAVIK